MGKTDKSWTEALRLELAAGGENHKTLRQIAKVVIAQAKAGDMTAIKEISERLEGKAVQAIQAEVTSVAFAVVPDTATPDEWMREVEAARQISDRRKR